MSKKVDRYKEKCKDLPHFDLVVENGKITIPSVFMFSGGAEELFSFLFACEKLNCTVVFENEKITVTPDRDDTYTKLRLSLYADVAKGSKVVNDYLKYLSHIENMTWDKVQS